MADIAKELLTPSFRKVYFIPTEWSLSFDHDQTEHKYPDRDSARVEATGRNPTRYRFKAVFRQGIEKTLREKDLYPGRWREFVRACLDRSTGELIHPELGPLKAKCKSLSTSFDPNRRDGVDVDVEFVESSDDESEFESLLAEKSPINAAIAAADLAKPINPADYPKYPEGLGGQSPLDALKKLKSTELAEASIQNLLSTIDTYTNAMLELSETIQELDNPDNYPLIDSLSKIIDALGLLATSLVSTKKATTVVLITQTMPLFAVASMFSMSVEDLLKLNPILANDTSVAQDQAITVYA